MRKQRHFRTIFMVTCFILLFSTISLINPDKKAYATDFAPKLETAPINPAFLEYEKKANQLSNGAKDEALQTDQLGSIPSPILLPNHNPVKKIYNTNQSFTSFPAIYDLRTTNKLTAVRNQGSSGSCWAFAAIASLESTLMPGEQSDFSENNLKNNSGGFDVGPNNGGNPFMSMAYLSRWDGPVSEADDPYNPNSVSSPLMQPQKHVQETIQFGYKDQSFSDIKSMVMQYGAVETRMYWNPAYFNSANNSYYYGGGSEINHEVNIVGWNDNYSKDNFLDRPSTNGAFIVRNSWGTSWGEQGYFYVSYEDMKIGQSNIVFNNAESTNNYSNNYQYDTLGWTDSVGYTGTSTAWMANAFSATSSEALSAISLYTPVPNSTYEIRVYNNFTGTFETKDPIKSGTINSAGYHTISLGTSIPVNIGEKFAISVKLTTPYYSWPIPVERPYANYSSNAIALPGQSYVSSDGSSWNDLTYLLPNTNVCLKVFTTQGSDETNCVITGQIKNVSGVPIPGVFVYAGSVNSGTSANETTFSSGLMKTLTSGVLTENNIETNSTNTWDFSKADGTYSLNVPPGKYILFLWPERVNGIDYGYQYYDNKLGPTSANVIQVASGETNTINPTLAVGGRISGVVTDPDGTGLPGILVMAYNQYGLGVGTDTDSTGHYEIPGVAATSYTVKFDPAEYNSSHGTNYVPQWYNNQPSESTAKSMSVVAGQALTNINAHLQGDRAALSVICTDPIEQGQGVGLDQIINITFNKNVVKGSSFSTIALKDNNGKSTTKTNTINGNVLTIKPGSILTYDTKYTVTIPAAAVKDDKNNALGNDYIFSFTTKAEPSDPHAIIEFEAIPSAVSLTLGKKQAVKVNLVYADDTKEDVTKSTLTTWESEDTDVATVCGGVVTGTGIGETTVTAYYNDDLSVEITVKVTPVVKSISADPADPINMILDGEDADPPTIIAYYDNDEEEDVTDLTTWQSSNPKIVEVVPADEGVTFHAKAKGTAKLTATYCGKKTTINVKVTTEITGFEAIPSTVSLSTGKKQAVKVNLVYADDTKEDVTKSTLTTWESEDTDIATVCGGVVTGTGIGETTVTVYYNDDLSSEITVNVTPVVKSISADPADPINMILDGEDADPPTIIALYGNDEEEDVTDLTTWQSSNPKIVKVVSGDEGVTFQAKAKGTAKLTATYCGKKTIINVKVTTEITDFEAIPSVVSLSKGKKQAVKVNLVYADDTKEDVTKSTLITWESGDTDVATVSGGVITGTGIGETTVTAYYNDDLYADITVNVTPVVKSISADPADPINMIIDGDDEYPPSIIAHYAGNDEDEDVTDLATWKSSNPKIVEVVEGDEGVTFHAVAKGTAKLTASYGSKTTKINVIVTSEITDFEAIPSIVSLSKGKKQAVKVNLIYADDTMDDVTKSKLTTWESEDTDVATVSGGVVTGTGIGETTVTAYYNDDLSAEITVKVTPVVKSISADPADPINIIIDDYEYPPTIIAYYGNDEEEDVTDLATWKSSNTKIVEVVKEDEGVIFYALAKGTAKLTATFGGKTTTISVTVAD
ncbi:MAG: lectin like domain-containing protein [Desulfitobacteriaceae bacterium]